MAATDKKSGSSGKCRFGATATITDANHSGGTVTVDATAHGFAVGDRVEITGVVGMTDLNAIHVVTGVNTNDFDVTLTTAQSYTSGGSARRILAITEWSLEVSGGVIDVTDSSSSTWREKIPNGLKEVRGTMTGFLLDGVISPTKGETIALKLDADGDNYWAIDAIISNEGVSLDVPGDSAVVRTHTFEGTGTLTETVG